MRVLSEAGIALLLAVLALAGLLPVRPAVVSAQSAVSATLDVSGTCNGSVNGSSSTYIDVTPNTTVSLSVTNNNAIVSQTVASDNGDIRAGTPVDNKGGSTSSQTFSLAVADTPVRITFTPVQSDDNGENDGANNCPATTTPTASTLLINPASATLSCTIQDNNWVLAGNFVGSPAGAGVYNGSNKIAAVTAAGAISQNVAAQTSAQTFNVLDGMSFGGKGTVLATATCPKYTAPAASQTTPTDTNKDKKTTTTDTGVKTVDTSGGTKIIKKSTAVAPTIVGKSNAVKYATGAGFGLLSIIIILVVLGLLEIWTTPLNLMQRLWQKIFGLFRRQPRYRARRRA